MPNGFDPGNLPDAFLALYAQVERDILADMARRISTYDYWIPAAEHQRRALMEMGQLHDTIMKRLSQMTGKSEEELNRLFAQGTAAGLAADTEIYQAAGRAAPSLAQSKKMQKVMRAGMRQTRGLLKNLTRTTARTASGQFEQALDRAWMQVNSGAFDANTAIRNAVKDLARQGVGAIRYPSGHTDTIEVAVRRAVVTGVNQTTLQMQWALADEMGCDLVETSAHGGARPEHARWQGRVFSRSGKHPKYPAFRRATGYGTGAGLGGWNCSHRFYPYFEGSPRTWTDEQLKRLEAKDYAYNGRRMTEYEATQMQRHIERKIRRWDREEAAMKAAGLPVDEAKAKAAQWRGRQADFARQTGLKRQFDRERVVNPAQSGILSVSQEGALRQYISAPSYALNDALRTGVGLTKRQKKLADLLDSALKVLPAYQGIVHRSLDSSMIPDVSSFLEQHEPGALITYPAFTSSSVDIYDKTMDIQLIIQSKNGRDIRTYNPKEQEILFPRGSKFMVEKREGNTIWLTEL